MTSRSILVIEDDASIRRGVVDALEFDGFQTKAAANGEAGLELAMRMNCDLVLLDLVLPGKGGLEILREIRAARPALPVIVLTARGEEADRVQGLRLGADDYVVKPFGVKERLARVEAVLRRSPARPGDVLSISIPGGQVDLARSELQFDDGGRMELSDRECELLRYLACNRTRAISRDEILRDVRRISPEGVTTRTIDMHIARLREKLRDDPARPQIILTVRGKGYMLAQLA